MVKSFSDEELMAEYKEIGLEKIKEGRAGVLILAGGLATRLGTNEPKGFYRMGSPSNKPLFQLLVEEFIKI